MPPPFSVISNLNIIYYELPLDLVATSEKELITVSAIEPKADSKD